MNSSFQPLANEVNYLVLYKPWGKRGARRAKKMLTNGMLRIWPEFPSARRDNVEAGQKRIRGLGDEG